MCKACAGQRPAAADMLATADVVEALLRRHAEAEAVAAALRTEAEGAAALRAAAAELEGGMVILEEAARAAEEARKAARCEAEGAAKKAAKATRWFETRRLPLSDERGAPVTRPAFLRGPARAHSPRSPLTPGARSTILVGGGTSAAPKPQQAPRSPPWSGVRPASEHPQGKGL